MKSWRSLVAFLSCTAILSTADRASGQDRPCDIGSTKISAGRVQLCPWGFLRFLGTGRSDYVGPSASTSFESISLHDIPFQTIGTFNHSRIALEGRAGVRSGEVKGFYSSDFLGGDRGNSYRVRQLWGEYRRGRWSFLGGQGWSLTRFNRVGTSSETEVFDTDIIDPGYFVGLLGARKPQFRVTYQADGDWQVAAAIQDDGRLVAKAVRDRGGTHVGAIALAAANGDVGFGPVLSLPIGDKFRFTTQHFVTKGAGDAALGLEPGGVAAYAGFVGLEWHPYEDLEIYTYDGLVYGARSGGNRRLWEWTVGFSRQLYKSQLGELSLGGQYAHVNRAAWSGGSRTLRYGMLVMTFALPE